MELQISPTQKIWLEAISHIYGSKQVFAQWKNMEQIGSEWNVTNENSNVGLLIDTPAFDDFLTKAEADKITLATSFILSQQPVVPIIDVQNALDITISPIDTVTRTVQVYDMKINYSEKWVRLYTRCVYSDNRDPKYVQLQADNTTLLPDGNGGTIGEYDYLYYQIYVTGQSLVTLQTQEIQMRATPDGGAKWD